MPHKWMITLPSPPNVNNVNVALPKAKSFIKLTPPPTPGQVATQNITTPQKLVGTQIWNGQEIPANIATKNLLAYDSKTGIRTFKFPESLGGGVYSQDANKNIVRTPRTNYGGVEAQKGFQRDDVVPVSLGGANAFKENIKMQPASLAEESDAAEKQILEMVKSGQISEKAAINEILRIKYDLENKQKVSLSKTTKLELPTIDETAEPGQAIRPPQIVGAKGALSKAGQSAFNIISSTTGNMLNLIDKALNTKGTTTEKVIAGGEAVMGVGQELFTMMAAPFVVGLQASEEIPGVNLITKPINWAFKKVGEGGGWMFKEALNAVPDSIISKEAKEKATPLAEQIGGLIAQIVFAKGTTRVLTGKKMSAKDRSVLQKAAKTPDDLTWQDKARIDGIAERMKDPSFWDKGAIKSLKDAIIKEKKKPTDIKELEAKILPETTPIVAPEAKKPIQEAVSGEKGIIPSKIDFSKTGSFSEFRNPDNAFMILTSANPMGKVLPETENVIRMGKFSKFLDENNVDYHLQKGKYGGNPEPSMLIQSKTVAEQKLIDNWLNKNSPQNEHILVKQGNAIRYDPRTGEAYYVDLKNYKGELSLEDATTDFYSEISGRKYRLPLYDEKYEKSLAKNEFDKIYNQPIGRVIKEEAKTKPITYEPTIKTSGLAESVKAKAIRDKMIYGFDKRFRDLPEYEKNTWKEKAPKATEYVLNNTEEAFEVAMGRKAVDPKTGLFPEDVFVAMDEYATATKNVEMIQKLANESALVGEATQMGQRIETYARLNPDSAVSRLRDIKKAKESSVKDIEGKRKTVKDTIKKETSKVNLKGEDLKWDKFLNSIIC